MPRNPGRHIKPALDLYEWPPPCPFPSPKRIFSSITITLLSHFLQNKTIRPPDQNTRPFPELSPITAEATAGSGGAAAAQEPGSSLRQPSAGETARLRNNRSMEGRRGFKRLTGQKAEPPWGVKFILLGSGQEEMTAGLSFCIVLEEGKKEKNIWY